MEKQAVLITHWNCKEKTRETESLEAAQSCKDLSIATGLDDIHGLKNHCHLSQEELRKKGETGPMQLTAPPQ